MDIVIRTAFCALGLLAAATSPAGAQLATGAPAHAFVASGDAQAPECKEALLLAQSMPRSKGPDPLTRLVLPRGMRSTVALGPPTDTSQANVLVASKDFEQLPLPGDERAYWSKRVEAGKRIVVTTSPRGEKEKLYSLYLLDASMRLVDFHELAKTEQLGEHIHPFISDQWPPLLFRLPARDVTWWLYMQPQEHHLQTWDIYARPVSHPVCRINLRFRIDVPPVEIQI
jgi:hypothetical protein